MNGNGSKPFPFIIFMRNDQSPINARHCRLFFLISALLLLCYGNSFTASWQMDDRPNILKNPRIQMSAITPGQIWTSMNAQPGSGKLYRPVACLTLALNWYFGKDNVFGYHAVNWLIHLGTSWLLYLTISLLLRTPRVNGHFTEEEIRFVAVSAALFWALNPVQTQAVTYIVQRMASMAGFFSLLAIYYYLRARLSEAIGRRQILFAASGAGYLLAILSKENSVILPLSIPVFEFFFFHVTKVSTAAYKKIFFILITGSFLSLLAIFALQPDFFEHIQKYYNLRPYTMLERVLTEQRILLFYLTQLFFPHPDRLSIAHDFPLSTSLFTPWETAAAILVNVLLIVLALLAGRKHPFLALAILFYYLNHLVESTIVPLELVFEHRNYLPSFFLFIPIALLLVELVRKVRHNTILLTLLMVLLATVFAAEGYATYLRNKAWKTEQSLWLDALRKAPNSDRPLAVLALQLGWGERSTEQDYRKALELIERTLTMVKTRKLADAAQLGNAASLHHKLGEYQAAIEYYHKALRIIPNDAMTSYNLAKVYISAGDFAKAKDILNAILAQGNVHADYFHLIGFSSLWQGRPAEAAESLRQAMSLAPGRPDIILALGRSLSLAGYHTRARWFLDLARQKGGENPIVSLCLIENCLLQGNEKYARAYLHHALQQHTLPVLLNTLNNQKTRYQAVPLNSAVLHPFITREVQEYVVR